MYIALTFTLGIGAHVHVGQTLTLTQELQSHSGMVYLPIPSGPEVEVMQTSSDLGSSGSRELFPSDLSMYNSELTLDPEINTENPSLTSDFK